MSFDLDAILRQIKPEKHRTPLKPDNTNIIVDVDELPEGPLFVVPDTIVYITVAAGHDGPKMTQILGRAMLYHSAVALSEIAQGVASFDPKARNFGAVRQYYTDLFRTIPASRVIVPDDDTWMRAGVITGILSRTQSFGKQQRKELYADALIYLSAAKRGLPVLTRNVRDFALIGQIHGSGGVIAF